MSSSGSQGISAILTAWRGGHADALSPLMDLLYPELRKIGRQYLRARPAGESLESAAVANEVYLKLVRAGKIHCENRAHFLALCSQMVRRILVDHVRRRKSEKRGGQEPSVPLDEVTVEVEARGIEVLALDEALDALARIDNRKSRVIELRYFGGLSLEETAEVLGISPETAKRDWKMARAWLYTQLTGKQEANKR
ncbi:MAG TPA: ECF-type sigma factor [Bryobacteraceae bacterium]|nr:ECF-type sigma factor [Bryobacteraceae bacterium]